MAAAISRKSSRRLPITAISTLYVHGLSKAVAEAGGEFGGFRFARAPALNKAPSNAIRRENNK